MSSIQKKVVKYFIKSSPAAEVNMILKDLVNIVDKEILEAEDVQKALMEYFELHKQHIKMPDGRMAMVTEIGRQNPVEVEGQEGVMNPFVYFDSKLGIKFTFDPNSLEATVLGDTSDFPEELDEQWAQYKSGVEAAIDTYVKDNYKDGTARACLCFNQDGNLQIDISCVNTNFTSFWAGEWQGSWLVDTQANTVSGSIKVNNHYFEQGNVQYSLQKDFPNIPLAAADGENIVAAISKTETDYQNQIEASHEGLNDVFKRMRRVLPVTGQRFNWALNTVMK